MPAAAHAAAGRVRPAAERPRYCAARRCRAAARANAHACLTLRLL